MSDRISMTEFARREGCHEKQVRRAVDRGALVRGADKLLDAAQLGSDWRKPNRRTATQRGRAAAKRSAAPVVAAGSDVLTDPAIVDFINRLLIADYALLPESLAVKEHALAARRLLEVRRIDGELVEISVAQSVLFEMARGARDAWLHWPSKVSALIAAELGIDDRADDLRDAMLGHINVQLEQLGEPEGDFHRSA